MMFGTFGFQDSCERFGRMRLCLFENGVKTHLFVTKTQISLSIFENVSSLVWWNWKFVIYKNGWRKFAVFRCIRHFIPQTCLWNTTRNAIVHTSNRSCFSGSWASALQKVRKVENRNTETMWKVWFPLPTIRSHDVLSLIRLLWWQVSRVARYHSVPPSTSHITCQLGLADTFS